MALLLSVPHQEPASKASVKRILQNECLLADLPESNTRDLEKCLQQLKKQNRIQLKPDKRWKSLEQYQQPLQKWEQKIDRNVSHHRISVPQHLADAAHISAQIEMELAYGYKIILLHQAHALCTTTPVARVIQRALWHLYQTYYRLSLQYRPVPEGIWFEMHQLFQSCTKNRKQRKIPHPRNPERDCTIANTYLQALLTGIFNPYQQLASTTVIACSFLDHFSCRAELTNYHNPDSQRGQFAIDPTLDLPARPLALAALHNDTTIKWLLNTKPLTEKLRQLWRQRHSRNEQNLVLDRLFITRALRTWDLAPCRNSERLRQKSACRMVIGLSASHQRINNNSLMIPDQLLYRATTTAQKIIGSRYQFILQQLSNSELVNQNTMIDWHQINESPTGFCLSGPLEFATTLDLGNILTININRGSWYTGIVRWARRQQLQVQIGVENLGPGVTPVAVMLDAAHRVTDISQGLLVPLNPLLQRPLSVLIEPGIFGKNQSMLFDDGYKLYRFRCVKLLERHRYFDWLALQACE